MFEEFRSDVFISTAKVCMPYRLLVPKELDSSAKYPLVLFFHGAGERGDDNEKQLLYGVERFSRPDSQSGYPCFVLAPQCPTHLGNRPIMWTGKEAHREELLKLAPEAAVPLGTSLELLINIQNNFQVDMDRIYVTGMSMGGFATWEVLIRHPQKFAAAIPVCGGGDKSHAIDIKDIPIWAFHGEDDSKVPVDCSRSMIKMIKEAGGHPLYKEYPGVGHNCWDWAYAEPDLLSWLFSQNRGKSAR